MSDNELKKEIQLLRNALQEDRTEFYKRFMRIERLFNYFDPSILKLLEMYDAVYEQRNLVDNMSYNSAKYETFDLFSKRLGDLDLQLKTKIDNIKTKLSMN